MSSAHVAIYSGDACKTSQYDVDIVLKDGAPWFRASDVTKVLGYLNGPQAVRHNVKAKYRATRDQLCLTGSSPEGTGVNSYAVDVGKSHLGGRPAVYVAEPGLHALILKSKKPEAEAFQDWVVETVLPEIRAKGSFQSRKPQTKLQALPDQRV